MPIDRNVDFAVSLGRDDGDATTLFHTFANKISVPRVKPEGRLRLYQQSKLSAAGHPP